MNTSWFSFELIALPPARLLLDSADMTLPRAQLSRSLLEGLRETMPQSTWPEVGFLGGTKLWPLDAFLKQGDPLWTRNLARSRYLGPSLVAMPNPGRLVIIGTGPIGDLEDWIDTPELADVTLMKFNDEIQLSAGRLPEMVFPGMDELAARLDQSPSRVSITADHAIVIGWDNPEYTWGVGGIISTHLSSPRVRVGFVSDEPIEPIAQLIREQGDAIPVELQPCEEPSPGPWQTLRSDEHAIIGQWIRTGGYVGPDGERHAPDGTPIAAFRELPPGTFVRLRIDSFAGRFQPVETIALVLEDDSVAIANESNHQLEIYEYDRNSRTWRQRSANHPRFFPLAGGHYGLLL